MATETRRTASTRPRSTSSATTSWRTSTTRSRRKLEDEDRRRRGSRRRRGLRGGATTRTEEDEELDEEDELEHVVSAETQEWDGLEAAEADADADEPTLVASARERVSQAGSAITSGFEKVGGRKVTSGFKAVRRHIGFPLWLRFLTASFVIIAAVAGATSASLILYLSDIANALKNHAEIAGLDPFLTKTTSSGPQTILIIGSDKRNQAISGKFGLSDTTMLLRLDPDRGAIALLSLPRDLKVDIPGVGTDKLNAAYSIGGPKLTLRTVKQLTGLQVNHLVNVDFTGFARAVNAIGCVYVDVDRRYYIAPNTGTSEINLQPGYQALCGFDALSFARYRHTDNDIVRAARQQAFLREARAKVPPSRLIEDRKKLVKIFTTYTSLGHRLRGGDAPGAEAVLRPARRPDQGDPLQRHARPVVRHRNLGRDPHRGGSVPRSAGHPGARRLERRSRRRPFPPSSRRTTASRRRRPPGRSRRARRCPARLPGPPTASSSPRRSGRARRRSRSSTRRSSRRAATTRRSPASTRSTGRATSRRHMIERAAYKWVFSLPTLGDYYGFEGTRWKDPPILSNPTDEKTIGDRDYKLFYDGDRLRMVAWQTDEGSFWVSNSLIETVPNEDMLKIARGLPPAPRDLIREIDREREGADRGRRGRLGRACHRCVLRRAGPSSRRPRDRPGEGRVAPARRGPDLRAGAARADRAKPGAAHLHHGDGGAARRPAPALRLRADAADVLGGRRSVGGAASRGGDRRAGGQGPGDEEHRAGRNRADDPPGCTRSGLRLVPGVPQGGNGRQGLPAARPRGDRGRRRATSGPPMRWPPPTSRSARRSSAPTSPARR